MEPKGFMTSFIQSVKAGDPSKVGTKLGQYMIEKNIPAAEVAKKLGVSRATIYYICQCKFYPRQELEQKIVDLIET